MKHKHPLQALTACLTILPLFSALALPCAAEEADETPEVTTYTCGDYVYSRLIAEDDETQKAACIVEYKGNEHDVVIPETLDDLPVVALGDTAFANYTYLDTVTLPYCVIQLGDYTFVNCNRLKAYLVDEDNPVFESKDGVLYANDGKMLVRYPLYEMPEEVTVPEGVTAIDNVAFSCSTTLKKINLPNSLTSIGTSAFSDCTALDDVTVPQKVTVIQPFTFNSCTSLKNVTLYDEVTEIGDAAFAATALEKFTMPANCTTIGQQAFAATNLKSIQLSDKVTDIGFCAFGWDNSKEFGLVMNSDFTIYAPAGSAAHFYAKDSENGNDFVFVNNSDTSIDSKDDSQPDTTTEHVTPVSEDTGLSIGRMIGIGACALTIVVIFLIAALSGKKKEDKQDEA